MFDHCVIQIAGIVYLSTAVAERLLSFHMKPPLDACTYFGMDSGQHPLKVCKVFLVLYSRHFVRNYCDLCSYLKLMLGKHLFFSDFVIY